MNTPLGPTGTPTADERTWGLIAHLAGFAGVLIPLGNVLGPLVVWFMKRDQSKFVGDHAKEALNFNITMLIVGVACWLLVFVLIGFVLLALAGLYWIVMTILAAIKANEGEPFQYPYALRLIK